MLPARDGNNTQIAFHPGLPEARREQRLSALLAPKLENCCAFFAVLTFFLTLHGVTWPPPRF